MCVCLSGSQFCTLMNLMIIVYGVVWGGGWWYGVVAGKVEGHPWSAGGALEHRGEPSKISIESLIKLKMVVMPSEISIETLIKVKSGGVVVERWSTMESHQKFP